MLTCEDCADLYDDKPPCHRCEKPKGPLIGTNAEAAELWLLLNSHGRAIDGLGGNPIPLAMRDIRQEAEYSTDPHTVVQKIILIDDIFIKAWRKAKDKK